MILFLLIDYFFKTIRASLSYFLHRTNARERSCVFSIKRNSTNKTDNNAGNFEIAKVSELRYDVTGN